MNKLFVNIEFNLVCLAFNDEIVKWYFISCGDL